MTTPDEHETAEARLLVVLAAHSVSRYVSNPYDYQAARIALLARAIELTAKKEVQISFLPS
jgi:hypothetical protein